MNPEPGRVSDTPQPLRVAAIVPGDAFSGPAGQTASTAHALARHGVEVRFILLRRPASPVGSLPALLRRRGLPFEIVLDHGPLDPLLALRVRRILRAWQPQIVETHGYKATALALLFKTFRAPWKWIGFFHGATTESWRARIYHRLDHHMLARADQVIVISEQQQRQLLHFARRTRVVHSGVTTLDDDAEANHDRYRSLIEQTPRPRLCVAGRLSDEKGVDVFLRAAAILRERDVKFGAIIAGDGPQRDQLHTLADRLGLNRHVNFAGHVHTMGQLYGATDLLVIPSRSEGLPSVLLEALQADVPVVATRVGAIPEVLERSGAGRLVPPDDPVRLADAIQDALSSLDDENARQARAVTAQAFSQDRRARTLVQIYREVVVTRKPSRRETPDS